jgi:hypothetical protein
MSSWFVNLKEGSNKLSVVLLRSHRLPGFLLLVTCIMQLALLGRNPSPTPCRFRATILRRPSPRLLLRHPQRPRQLQRLETEQVDQADMT